MQNIIVSRYPDPKAVGGWAGYIEPADKSWIAFIDVAGRPLFFLNRDPETGGVVPDDPKEREAELQRRRAERAELDKELVPHEPETGEGRPPSWRAEPPKES